MLRRTFIGALAGVVVAPALSGRAQQAKPALVGILTPHFRDPAFAGFFERLRELGYHEGSNLTFLRRSVDGQLGRLPKLAVELVEAKVDLVVAIYTPGSRAAIDATKAIPVVIGLVGDPVGTGLVTTLARPGGNVTGVSNMSADLVSKRLEILKEAVLSARRIAVVFNPEDPVTHSQIAVTEHAAQKLGVEVRFWSVRSDETLASAFAELVPWGAGGVMWLAGQANFVPGTVRLAATHRLPTMVVTSDQVHAGGLMSYYADHLVLFRRVADYVDAILKGAAPGDLPVELPTRFQLVINLKTAKALALTLPPVLLARADELIE